MRPSSMPIPPRLLAHLQRWKERKIIARHFVEFNGEGVGRQLRRPRRCRVHIRSAVAPSASNRSPNLGKPYLVPIVERQGFAYL
jgi:hypothetical protein